MISVFIRDPRIPGPDQGAAVLRRAQRLVETALRDPFDHWLAGNPEAGRRLLDFVIERAEERLKRKEKKDTPRIGHAQAAPARQAGRLRHATAADGTEIFLVEGDSAGGSAKQARDRATQAILPLRGKILNVASASPARSCGEPGARRPDRWRWAAARGRISTDEALRYERIIIMTDADVDGAHIASLLITFFYREHAGADPPGPVYLALPPLYRLEQGAKTVYARDDAAREKLLTTFKGKKPEISRFKGLGEMPPGLKETTMDPAKRTLLRIQAPPETRAETSELVESLMGKPPSCASGSSRKTPARSKTWISRAEQGRSSFCEQKEAKKLYKSGPGALATPVPPGGKSFLVLFFQKRTSSFSNQASHTKKRPGFPRAAISNSSLVKPQTIFFRLGEALKRTVLPAFTLISSPVRGFTPLRALVLRTVKVPKLGSVNFPFFFISRTIASIRSVAARFAATPVISAEF